MGIIEEESSERLMSVPVVEMSGQGSVLGVIGIVQPKYPNASVDVPGKGMQPVEPQRPIVHAAVTQSLGMVHTS
jgi:hypothetical protein